MFSEKIVTIGGGTGTHTVLSGLKKFPFDITSIVTVADSGGSTGMLRDEFGYLPVGDFRMALTALASSEEESTLLRNLFLYRFEKGGEGLKGHNFGNLFLVAMADVLGSYDKAIKYTSKILRIKGRILPITSTPIDLYAEYENGEIAKGEASIDFPDAKHDGTKHISKLWIEPETYVDAETAQSILEADFVILGPGDLYTSILPNIVVHGTAAAICKTNAKIIYVVNLVTKFGQTHGFSARNHVDEIFKYIGRYPDYVIFNEEKVPDVIIEKYKEENAYPVLDDLDVTTIDDYKIIKASILTPAEIVRSKGDAVKRSLLRHDPDKLAWEIVKIIVEEGLRQK